jgi:UDPglucose--hexose-1-phosphate uridylyltransferase
LRNGSTLTGMTGLIDPLAPQSPGNPSEIPSGYDVAVFANRSPAFG